MTINSQKIIFDLPEETDLVDVIYDILEKNNIKDTPDQWAMRAKRNEESQAVIMKNATVVLFKKIVPDEKIIDLLQKYLTISPEKAKSILQDLKNQLLPYAKFSLPEKPNLGVGVKPIEIKNVAQNAKANEGEKKFTQENKDIILQTQEVKKIEPPVNSLPETSDKYREPI